MYYVSNVYYQYPYYGYNSVYRNGMPYETSYHPYGMYVNPFGSVYRFENTNGNNLTLKDYGPHPFVININEAAKQNNTYRTALWTGSHLQVTLMSLNVGEDIGLEMHPNVDQFLRIEQGEGIVRMGRSQESLDFERQVSDDSAIFVPAGTWHNLINTGNVPLKLYSIYAPPNHPFGTVHATKAAAMAAEE